MVTFKQRLKKILVGESRSLSDERVFHKVSLIAVFAWVGLGADGLSSSCYGPEEAFKALGAHTALAPLVALAGLFTIAIICASYTQIIGLFPGGGGGYLVGSKLLSPAAGVVSGCALLIDYVLTIAISIASGGDALFSILPPEYAHWKFAFILAGTLLLTGLNLRGVRESVVVWVPIFFLFVATHGVAIIFAFFDHVPDVPVIAGETAREVHGLAGEIGWLGIAAIILRAYSVGAGTYTGIEAVSNGLPILREPRVKTGKRTMVYMGVSLAFTVVGLLFAYLLYRVEHQAGKTLNAVLFESITASWPEWLGSNFVMLAMTSATALLFIAAQAGFLDGPRVLANMALDRWFPSRFASLSDRFVSQNGIVLMGVAAIVVLLMTRGSVGLLVVLYSINVFITFTISQLGMVLHWWRNRHSELKWRRRISINFVGLVLTTFILVSLCWVKFWEGGWITLVATGTLVFIAYCIRNHYRQTFNQMSRLNDLVKVFETDEDSKKSPGQWDIFNPAAKTAVLFVNGFNGLGVHTLLAIQRMFPNVYRNFVFIQVGVVDAGNFKGASEIENLRSHIEREGQRYVEQMTRRGFHAESVCEVGIDIIESAGKLADQIRNKYPQAVFFGGQLVFANESFLSRLLHNYVVFALQRKLFRQGAAFLILPIRV